MNAIAEAPVAKIDWLAVILGAVLVFVPTLTGTTWLALNLVGPFAIGGSPVGIVEFWKIFIVTKGVFQVVSLLALVAAAISLVVALAVALAVAIKISTPRRIEIHHEGGRLRVGAVAARAVLAGETGRSPADVFLAGLPITRDRLRRSLTIFGSPGGGKTQIIWHLIRSAVRSGYRMLVVDGPKGDYSRSMPGQLLIVAPWHSGPAWDIAADCPTRNHARELARALIPVSGKDPLWGNAANMIFIACVCKLQVERGSAWGWGDLLDLILLPVDQLKPIAERFYPPATQAVADAESKTTQSIVINLTAFMQDVYEMALAWKDAKEKFSFCNWWSGTTGPQTVILQGSGEFSSLAGGYISAVVKMIAALTASPSFADSSDRKNLIVIDELAQLPKLDGLEKFMEIGRSKGCPAILATQSPSQLRKIYGEDDLAAWMSMAGTRLFVRTSGASDLAFVMREIGEKKVYIPTQSSTISASGTAVSRGFAQETQPIVGQEYLSKRLGPTPKLQIRFLAQLAADPVELEIPILTQNKLKPVRSVFIPNPKFNAPLEIREAQPIAAEPVAYCSTGNGQEITSLSVSKDVSHAVAAAGCEAALSAYLMQQQQATDTDFAEVCGLTSATETTAAQSIQDGREYRYSFFTDTAPATKPDGLDDVLDFLANATSPAELTLRKLPCAPVQTCTPSPKSVRSKL